MKARLPILAAGLALLAGCGDGSPARHVDAAGSYRSSATTICARVSRRFLPNAPLRTNREAVQKLRAVADANATESRELGRLKPPAAFAVHARLGAAALSRAAYRLRLASAQIARLPDQSGRVTRRTTTLIDRYSFPVFVADGHFRAIGVKGCGQLAPGGR